jgi:hypothetical protein
MKTRAKFGGRFLPLLLAATILLLLPAAAFAAQGSDFVVTGGTSGTDYTCGSDGTLTFTAAGNYTVSMAAGVTGTATDKIVINGGTESAPVSITLSGVHIDQSSTGGCAFELQNSSRVNLTLSGSNSLKSGMYYAGLQVPIGTTLTITSGDYDSLTATGSEYGAGIRGRERFWLPVRRKIAGAAAPRQDFAMKPESLKRSRDRDIHVLNSYQTPDKR